VASRHERLIANQEAFRSANERLQAIVEDAATADRLIPFICECADDDCLGRIEMTGAEYDEVHADRDSYSVLHGHPRMDGEVVVEQRALYDIVSKRGLP
jgi:hypothetical protein